LHRFLKYGVANGSSVAGEVRRAQMGLKKEWAAEITLASLPDNHRFLGRTGHKKQERNRTLRAG
jgi:hypothetical protein